MTECLSWPRDYVAIFIYVSVGTFLGGFIYAMIRDVAVHQWRKRRQGQR